MLAGRLCAGKLILCGIGCAWAWLLEVCSQNEYLQKCQRTRTLVTLWCAALPRQNPQPCRASVQGRCAPLWERRAYRHPLGITTAGTSRQRLRRVWRCWPGSHAPEGWYCAVLVVLGRGSGRLVVILTTNHNRPVDTRSFADGQNGHQQNSGNSSTLVIPWSVKRTVTLLLRPLIAQSNVITLITLQKCIGSVSLSYRGFCSLVTPAPWKFALVYGVMVRYNWTSCRCRAVYATADPSEGGDALWWRYFWSYLRQ